MRNLIPKRAGLMIAVTINSIFAPNAIHAQPAPTPPAFTKQALDANGAPLTGPVAVGQTIQYVLGYSASTLPAGPLTIGDTLSANLAYVNPSIVAPPDWSWTPGPGPTPPVPYSIGNQETYNNPGFAPGLGFILNVTVGVGQAAAGGGDGFAPIPVPALGRVFGVFHHATLKNARITCWDAATLALCPGYPQWLNTMPDTVLTNQRTTPQKPLAVVGGTSSTNTRIYYPSARYDGTNTFLGIGCFDVSGPGAACSFIDLLGLPSVGGQVDGQSLNPVLAGIVANPARTRLYAYALDRVHCIDISGVSPIACAGFNSPTLIGTGSRQNHIIAATGSPRLIVSYGVTTGNKAALACLDMTTGARCAGWPTAGDPQAPVTNLVSTYGPLSLLPNATGTTVGVCLHPIGGTNPQAECYDLATGALATGTSVTSFKNAAAMLNKTVIDSFNIPGTGRVLYGRYINAMECFDFAGSGGACGSFTPFWGPTTTNYQFKDYGYAVDPNDESCLLGLGHAGELWRFARNTGAACVKPVEATFDLGKFFCAIKPQKAFWTGVTFLNPPSATQLTGGTINVTVGSTALPPIQYQPGTNTYPFTPNVSAVGSGGQATVSFTPVYGSTPPQADYQIQLTFTADVEPQICYKATVRSCGPVSNKATLQSAHQMFDAGVNLGDATGPACEPGLIKVCKVAGPGIAIGTPFNFTVGSSPLTVPAGPAPGGTCMIGPTLPVGSVVTVDEAVPTGYTVSSIDVLPPKQLAGPPNLAAGSVNVTVGAGVTVVTFTDKLTGFLEVCKRGDVTGNFTFTVSPGGLGPFVVPAGACTPPIEVIAGSVIVTEQPSAGNVMIGCTTFPAGQQGACDVNAQTSTVTVAAGNVSTETIAFITNRKK
jgi:hypothetical protein